MDQPAGEIGVHLKLIHHTDVSAAEFIHRQIKDFNTQSSPHHRHIRGVGARPLNVLLYDQANQLMGGLIASTYWGWLDIDDFWLSAPIRRQGHGRTMLRMAEEEARARGCQRAMLQTFSFQARAFYEKQGYRVAGVMEDYPPGASFFWMRKELNEPTPLGS